MPSKVVETDCVAGHVGLELRNVAKNYLFERSDKFPGSGRIMATSSSIACMIEGTPAITITLSIQNPGAPDTLLRMRSAPLAIHVPDVPWSATTGLLLEHFSYHRGIDRPWADRVVQTKSGRQVRNAGAGGRRSPRARTLCTLAGRMDHAGEKMRAVHSDRGVHAMPVARAAFFATAL
jgi:hypothetical protein